MTTPIRIPDTKYSPDDIQRCIDVLQELVDGRVHLAHLSVPQRIALLKVTGQISRPDREEVRQRRKDRARLKRQKIDDHERKVRASTGIRAARTETVFTAPKQITHSPEADANFKDERLINPRDCYICKAEFTKVHFFYDTMCPACAVFNYAKRFQTASLDGQIALITGSRLKIGYQASLMMLRAGALVIATTRFPIDSALRYSKEEDFHQWKDRLHIYGLDLRHTPSVELFCSYVERKYPRLDLLVNNAAQTVRRPPGFYAHLMAGEAMDISTLPPDVQALLRPFEQCKRELIAYEAGHRISQAPAPASRGSHTSDGLNTSSPATASTPAASSIPASPSAPAPTVQWHGTMPGMGITSSAKLSQIPYVHDDNLVPAEQVFPTGKLDADLQQVDLRTMNSWRLALGEIDTAEMIELQLVNAIAPFVLCNRLMPMMKRDNTGRKHMVNVSAMEGKFHRFTKTDKHPHTNMAKAALNMLTRTSAIDLDKHGIFMNAVDTGWVTDEDPAALAQRKLNELDFQPPLDVVDGAARVCDPFFHGIITGTHWNGKFLKDYFPVDW